MNKQTSRSDEGRPNHEHKSVAARRLELERITQTLQQQNAELEEATRLLRQHPDAAIAVDPELLDELRAPEPTLSGAVSAPSAGVRC